MSDEDDYMSDAFITGQSHDIRPGLIQNRSLKRKHENDKKKISSDLVNRERHKPVRVLQDENLKSGLSKPLDSGNKGFALLEKMGFKPGSGLGKEGTGRSEPLPVEVKNNREGLGVKAQLQEMRAEKERRYRETQENAPSLDDYRSRIIDEANERQAGIDLYKSQKTCEALDLKEGILVPMERWFWPDRGTKKGENEEEEEESEEEKEVEEPELSVQDKLEMLTVYLRRTYYYCVWCGTTFDDEKDMQQECPGPTRNDH